MTKPGFIGRLIGNASKPSDEYDDEEFAGDLVAVDPTPPEPQKKSYPDPLVDDASYISNRLVHHRTVHARVTAEIKKLTSLKEDLEVSMSAQELALKAMMPRLKARDEQLKEERDAEQSAAS